MSFSRRSFAFIFSLEPQRLMRVSPVMDRMNRGWAWKRQSVNFVIDKYDVWLLLCRFSPLFNEAVTHDPVGCFTLRLRFASVLHRIFTAQTTRGGATTLYSVGYVNYNNTKETGKLGQPSTESLKNRQISCPATV